MHEKGDLKKRLAELNRRVMEEAKAREERRQAKREASRLRREQAKAAAEDPETPDPEWVEPESPPPKPVESGLLKAPAPENPAASTLEELFPGREILRPDGGAYWLVEQPVSEIIPGMERFNLQFMETFVTHPPSEPETLEPEVREFLSADPHDALFLDLETCGLSGAPLFLVGTLETEGDQLVIRQHFARNYAEERHLLAEIAGHLDSRRLLVTFNGKTYDVPFLRDRGMVNGIPLLLQSPHLDLLHPMRRRFRKQLPNCKLTTLERFVCGRTRVGDIPGAEIPDAYHAYVRTANAAQIVEVLKHNRLDLVTLADLMTRFPE